MLSTSQRIAAIRHCLQVALQPSQLEVINESHLHVGHAGAKTGKGHFKLVIATDKFAGQSKIACHRMIYQALESLMETDIHALTMQILD